MNDKEIILEAEQQYDELKNLVLTGDIDEILDGCRKFIKYHIKDVHKFMNQ